MYTCDISMCIYYKYDQIFHGITLYICNICVYITNKKINKKLSFPYTVWNQGYQNLFCLPANTFNMCTVYKISDVVSRRKEYISFHNKPWYCPVRRPKCTLLILIYLVIEIDKILHPAVAKYSTTRKKKNTEKIWHKKEWSIHSKEFVGNNYMFE